MTKKYNIEVYDLETLASCFTYTGFDINTHKITQFVLHKDKFELLELIEHLQSLHAQIGFNNIGFDYPILHYILENFKNSWFNKYESCKEQIITSIYKEAQRIIEIQNLNDPSKSAVIQDKDTKIQQVDLFRIWHYNNKARMTSLKALEISMNYPNVMDMPIDHSIKNISLEDVKLILEYNLNDVLATYEFYKKSKDKIELRKSIKNKYKLPCINYSDSKIGEALLLKLYCDELNLDPREIKNLRTKRDCIYVRDIIFDYIKFESKEFINLLEYFKVVEVRETKNAFKKSVIYKGFQYDYGTGGIHGCIKPGVYESNEDYIIIDADVASLYPNVAIKNKLFIEHLGKTFIELYDKDIVQERIRAKKAGEMSISDALKLSANSVYGKSNDKFSFLYDPQYTMATTINGQLLLTMLAESLVNNIKNITMIQANTDGITVKIPKNQQDIYYKLCKEWETKTNLELEYVDYSKMIIKDVNNYIAVSTKGKIKYKGAFEIDKVVGNEPAYHKDNSFRIIPLAISEYFINNKNIKDTILNHTNIYDFCGRQKFSRDSYGEIHYISRNSSEITIEKQQKNVRYYISKSGKKFVKQYSKGSSEIINKGYDVEIFNKYIEKEMNDYKIDYSFYIREVNKIIDILKPSQINLIELIEKNECI